MTGTGLCECGCGQKTNLAPATNRNKGWAKGEPYRFVHGHNSRGMDRSMPRKPGPRWLEADRGHETPCWVWQLAVTTQGYGLASWRGRNILAHRRYYMDAKGPIPEGLQLDHLCRVRACVNQDHLEPVTPAENIRRGLGTKLTAADVKEIRSLHGRGLPVGGIAAGFGVSEATVYDIAAERSWAA